jgi:hypothetical protein
MGSHRDEADITRFIPCDETVNDNKNTCNDHKPGTKRIIRYAIEPGKKDKEGCRKIIEKTMDPAGYKGENHTIVFCVANSKTSPCTTTVNEHDVYRATGATVLIALTSFFESIALHLLIYQIDVCLNVFPVAASHLLFARIDWEV